jgi:hypothetical protein
MPVTGEALRRRYGQRAGAARCRTFGGRRSCDLATVTRIFQCLPSNLQFPI